MAKISYAWVAVLLRPDNHAGHFSEAVMQVVSQAVKLAIMLETRLAIRLAIRTLRPEMSQA